MPWWGSAANARCASSAATRRADRLWELIIGRALTGVNALV